MKPSRSNAHSPAWRTAIRSAVWVLACAVATLALWFAFDLVYVSTGNEADHASPADVIIMLRCPSYEGNVISMRCTRLRTARGSGATIAIFQAQVHGHCGQ